MIKEIEKLTAAYHVWLRAETDLRPVGDAVEITTPYLDRHNDCLQIYARRLPAGEAGQNGGFLLTDDGYIIEDLEQGGCVLDSSRRQGLLTTALNGFGVRRNGSALEVRTSAVDFALRKHNLIQAMLAVNDLFCLASPTIAAVFHEDVVEWLDGAGIRYTPKARFTGKSGYGHTFDFVIPKSPEKPERMLRAINRPTRDAAQTMAFAWMDTRRVRSPQSRAYALLNDSGQSIQPGVREALNQYGVHPVPWSKRDSTREELAA